MFQMMNEARIAVGRWRGRAGLSRLSSFSGLCPRTRADGYTRDFDVEQVYRDNRLNPIHEGTHGIQAIDLVGRKILRDSGAALALLGERITGTIARPGKGNDLVNDADALNEAWTRSA